MVHHEILFSSSQGVWKSRLDPDSGKLSSPERLTDVPTRWLVPDLGRGRVFATGPDEPSGDGRSGVVLSFRANADLSALELIAKIPTSGVSANNLALLPDSRIAVTHYAGMRRPEPGNLGLFRITADGRLEGEVCNRQLGTPAPGNRSHVHCAAVHPQGKWMTVADLGQDRIFLFDLSPGAIDLAPIGETFVGEQTGPRHLLFSADGKRLFASLERSNEAAAFHFDPVDGTCALTARASSLPADLKEETCAAADIHHHPAKPVLYLSNRMGSNSIAAIDCSRADGSLERLAVVDTGGEIPRGFAVSPDGDWIIVAHQKSDTAMVLPLDKDSGIPRKSTGAIELPGCECVRFFTP